MLHFLVDSVPRNRERRRGGNGKLWCLGHGGAKLILMVESSLVEFLCKERFAFVNYIA